MFTHIQVKSAYSLLQSPLTLDQIIGAAKERGFSAIGLSDVNVVYGIVDFYSQALKAGIKPLLGMTVQLPDCEFLVVAETTAGYHQLLRLSSAIMMPQTPPTLADLPNLAGLAVIVPGAYLLSPAFKDRKQKAEDYFQTLKAKQPASLYLGVTAQELTTTLPQFAGQNALPLLALSRVSYLNPTDAFTQKVMGAIKDGAQLNFRDPTLMDAGPDWLTKADDAAAPFQQASQQQALDNLQALVDRCDVTIEFKQPQLPHFPTPDDVPAKDYLHELATKGLAKRFNGQPVPQDYQDRLTYELKVINEMGFADYFLVVWDVMNHAHEVGIMMGPGRGSAAGSLVAYALAITEVDPLKYNLLFERFLNPARQQMPDIDIDIPDDRRQELIAYVHEFYGQAHMAQIITFGTFGAKQALRDVARVFGLSQFDSDKWSKAIPAMFKIDLTTAYKDSLPLRNLISDSDQNRALYQTALALEGLPRHYSTHAAGIVLAQEPLTDTVAVQDGGDGIAQTQVTMTNVERLGLLKIDFLGLRNLSILARATQSITYQTKKPFDPKQIPLDDAETLKLFARGDTNGVFQFESAGIRSVLRRLQPTAFEDVVATNALYRPGPIEQIDTFIKRKHGEEPITYPAAALKPILEPTYGVLVYQEQVMQVASTMGGFSLGEADLLRRAMSKKKAAVLAAEQTKFIEGAKAKGFDQQTAETVYDYIDHFANYGFNRSHAVAYSMIAFWLAYIKVHYPTAFFAALMNGSLNNATKLRQYVQELKSRKIKVLGPDINRSKLVFRIEGAALRFGLLSIKGMRRDFADALLTARQSGPFKSVQDVLQRIDVKWLKPENFTAMIQAGAFDQFDDNRAQVQANLAELIETVKLAGNDVTLFEAFQPKTITVPRLSATEQLDQEAAVLGVYLSGHPVDRYVEALSPFMPLVSTVELEGHTQVTVVLVIRRIKRIRTKKGQEMAFLDGQDGAGQLSVTVFPSLYPAIAEYQENQVIVVQGKVEERDGLQLIANRIELGDEALANLPQAKLFIRLADPDNKAGQRQLMQALAQHHGGTPVILVNGKTRESIILNRRYWVDDSDETVTILAGLVGGKNVVRQRLNGADEK